MQDIYLDGKSLEVIFDEMENSFCPDCAEEFMFHECTEWCDDYHLYCGDCI